MSSSVPSWFALPPSSRPLLSSIIVAFFFNLPRLLTVHPAEVAVPANGDNVGKEHAVLQGQKGKVDCLNHGPQHPVGLQRRPPRLLQAFLGAVAFHRCHAAEERSDHDRREQTLVAGHTSEGLNPLVASIDIAGKEAEPSCSNRAKHAYNKKDQLALCHFSFAIIVSSIEVTCTHIHRIVPCVQYG